MNPVMIWISRRAMGALVSVMAWALLYGWQTAASAQAPSSGGAATTAAPTAPAGAGRTTLSATPLRHYVYKANTVFTVPTGLGIATQIVLEPGEVVQDFGTGFTNGWEIVRREHIFYLKPKDPDAETNMYVRTNRRSYLFDLKIVTKDWLRIEEAKSHGVAYMVTFSYPDSPAATRPNAPATVKTEPTVPSENPYMAFHTRYESASNAASRWLQPLRVYDDGSVTYVRLPPTAQAPAFFGRTTEMGEEYILNRTVRDGMYVLHGVHPYIVIRHGTDVVAVRRR